LNYKKELVKLGYRLEITKSKKGDEKINNLTVKELIAGVDVMSEQLQLILEEVKKRDNLVLELENDKDALNDTIAKLANEMQEYIEKIANMEEHVEELNNVIKEQQDRIEERDNKIKRMESEAQERYEDNCKLKDRLIDVVNEKNDLLRKVNSIVGIIREDGDDK
jgi:chromosome segregation ATPase